MSRSLWAARAPIMRDVAALATIATAVSQPASHVTPQAIAQQNGRFWVITRHQQPVGYATLLPLPGLPHLFELSGGIQPRFQRQGAGSFLWQVIKQDIAGTAVQQITHTVKSLATPAARFLQHCQFSLEHEEYTMTLEDLDHKMVSVEATPLPLQRIDRQTAVASLPELYRRCFAGTPWFQPYSPAEIAAVWEPNDELFYLGKIGDEIGFAWLHFPEEGLSEIEPIGIAKEKQGRGHGRFLLTSLLHRLKNKGIQTVTLGVWANNLAAVRLYRSLGFQRVSSSYSLLYKIPQT